MESSPKKIPRNKIPALALVLLALVVMVFVIWRVDSAPSTSDAYASADTIDVVPEVSGRIVELAVVDNQQVKKGDLLFRIDPRPYEASLAKAEALLAALDKQIMLTQRSVDRKNMPPVPLKRRSPKRVRRRNRPTIRCAVPSRYCRKGLFRRKMSIAQEPRSVLPKPISMRFYYRRNRPPAP